MGLWSVITASAYACLWLCPSLGEKSGFSRHTQLKNLFRYLLECSGVVLDRVCILSYMGLQSRPY